MSEHASLSQIPWRVFALSIALCSTAFAQAAGEPTEPLLIGQPPSLEIELGQRAEAQFATGNVSGALATHALLENVLVGEARTANRDLLWKALNRLPQQADFTDIRDPWARGWIELMQLARTGAPLSAFEEWRERHPNHPGESQIAAGFVASPAPLPRIGRQFALLLPTSGPLAAASKAIQTGAEAAQARAGEGAPRLISYDMAAALETNLAALQFQGADAVIGPLRKEEVATLAARPLPMPVVTLNYLDAGSHAPPGMTFFGLAPEDEARAAADHAAGSSLLRAVVLVQQGDWGERSAAAFRAQFEARGGTVLMQDSFTADKVDFVKQLKQLLGITYSEARGAELTAKTGIKAEMLPVPRGDIDVVFIAARSAQAKMIWPQMRFLRAGRIATYITAAASDAGSQDLGGLRVCDAPWRIETRGATAALRGELATVNPRSADAQRLFALGFDAYELARRATAGALPLGETFSGLTGRLAVQDDGSIRRYLDCPLLNAPSYGESLDPPLP